MKDWQAGDKKLSRRIDEIDESNVTSVNTQTGAVVLDAEDVGALPVDGKASDSERLDDIDSTGFVQNQLTRTTLDANLSIGISKVFKPGTGSTNLPGNEYGSLINLNNGGDTNQQLYLEHGHDSASDFWYRSDGGSTMDAPWRKVWTSGNDGSGSGLDADSVDGIEVAGLVKNTPIQIEGNNIDTHIKSGFFYGFGGAHSSATAGVNPFPSLNGAFTLNNNIGLLDSASYSSQIAMLNTSSTAAMEIKFRASAGTGWGAWQDILTTLDTGAGNGLDADSVDAIHAWQFIRSDIAYTASKKITFTEGLDITGGINDLSFEGKHHINNNDGGGNFNIRIGNHFTTGITEEGYASHWVYTQSVGTWDFKSTTASQTVGTTPIWKTSFSIGANEVISNNQLRPTTTGIYNLGTDTYRWKYVYATYLNINHGQSTRSSDTIFYSSTDVFLRKNTASGMRDSLDVPSKQDFLRTGDRLDIYNVRTS